MKIYCGDKKKNLLNKGLKNLAKRRDYEKEVEMIKEDTWRKYKKNCPYENCCQKKVNRGECPFAPEYLRFLKDTRN